MAALSSALSTPSTSATPTASAKVGPVSPCIQEPLTQELLRSCAKSWRTWHLEQPADRRERAGIHAVEPVERGQAAPARDAQRGCAVHGGRDPERAVQRRRDVDLLADGVAERRLGEQCADAARA